jgi:23S rRNA pseudouridine2605 synthase
MPKSTMRIQKALSDCGYTSRRKAEELVRQGRIKINGHPAVIGAEVNPHRDVITVDGERIYTGGKKQNIYIALYKPRGYVTSMSDELGRRTVDELVEDLGTRVYPIGRLDRNSEGLLLMTNDGEFANQMMHPKYKVAKTYRVTVHNCVNEDQITKMASGVVIDGRKTEPCEILVQEKTPTRSVMQIVLREGRNRQIRKMCESVGLEVARLKRLSVGAVKLGVLQPGEYRHLTSRELELLKSRLQSQDVAVGYKEPKNTKVGRNFGKDDFKPKRPSYNKPTRKKTYHSDYDDFEDYGIEKKKKSDKWYENIKKR